MKSMPHTRLVRWCVCVLLAIGGVLGAAPVLPIAPVDSAYWRFANRINGGNFNEQLGWPELARVVADIRGTLPADARAHVGILAADTGQAAALDLYGEPYALPKSIPVTNSHWFRGYGDPPPRPLIVVGVPDVLVQRFFESCRIAGRFPADNSSVGGKNIYVCDGPREPWPQFWQQVRQYG